MALTAGQKLRAANLGQQNTAAQYQSSVGQVIGNTTDTPIAFGTANVTSDLVTRAVSGVGHKFTLGKSGLWAVTTTCRFPATATGERSCHIEDSLGLWHHSQSQAGSSGAPSTLCVGFVKYLTAGDWVQVEVYQSSGGNITTDSNALLAFGRIDIVGILLDD